VGALNEALQVGACMLIMIALAIALLGVWRDDHKGLG
jgi:hypothetical protein